MNQPNQRPMDTAQALNILRNATALLQLPRNGHMEILQALDVIAAVLFPVPAPEQQPEDSKKNENVTSLKTPGLPTPKAKK